MPRGFSEKERDYIRQKIIEVGTEFFGKYGIRKTNVEEITKRCGIAKGTFYLFFPSKEHLFLRIFEDLTTNMHQTLYKKMIASPVAAREKLTQFLRDQYLFMSQNPIFNVVLNREEIEYLIRKFPEAVPRLTASLDEQQYVPFIEQLKQFGILKDVDNQLAIGELKLVFFLFTHRNDYSEGEYQKVFERVLEFVTMDLAADDS